MIFHEDREEMMEHEKPYSKFSQPRQMAVDLIEIWWFTAMDPALSSQY